jgi:transposase-like protein
MMEAFDTDHECRAYMEALRWPYGIKCPRCQSEKISRIKERKQFECDGCRYQFSVTAGTIFHDSHLGLPKWLLAIFLMCEAKKSMSALQLKRTMGVSYKTAWYMCHRIREAMKTEDAPSLTGTVEVDETYVGGVKRGRGRGRGNFGSNKSMVLGAIERGGQLRIRAGKTNSRKELHGFINEAAKDAERIVTDEWPAYKGLNKTHETITHSKGEYVRGDIHTNSVESAFSLFKRAVVGSFHQVSHKHIDRYLDEFEFRFNNRKNRFMFRDVVRRLLQGEALPYETLIERKQTA